MRIPVWLQLVLVLCFLALPILSAPRAMDNGFILQGPLVRMFIVYGLFVLFFYIHYYVLLDRFFYRKMYALYTVCVVASFVLILLVPEIIRHFVGTLDLLKPPDTTNPGGYHLHHRPPFWTEYPRHFFLFVSTLLLGHFIRTSERLIAAKQERTQAELSYLKAQINPHFLFNTLNSIYSLSLTKNERTPNAILQLSGMMRHVLIDAQADKIPLKKELEYVSNYIELQKLRIDDSVNLDYFIDQENSSGEIAPLLLIPFIENAFKYGVNPEQNCVIYIKIKTESGILTMNVKNTKANVLPETEDRTRVGLDNVKNRLNLLYTDQYQLKIVDDLDTFAITLTIKL